MDDQNRAELETLAPPRVFSKPQKQSLSASDLFGFHTFLHSLFLNVILFYVKNFEGHEFWKTALRIKFEFVSLIHKDLSKEKTL